MRIVPKCPLLTTITTMFNPYCIAVASSLPAIMKQPSPASATTARDGYSDFAASAAGTP